jgi:hypothetical protein
LKLTAGSCDQSNTRVDDFSGKTQTVYCVGPSVSSRLLLPSSFVSCGGEFGR